MRLQMDGWISFQVVPTNITTAHGGFYINTGNLEFKARESADEDSDLEAVYQVSRLENWGHTD